MEPHLCDVVIVGAGLGGLAMAIQLRRHGREDFVILEKADEVGGTWRDNQYPGAACDVQSHLYSLSFAPNPNWSQRYPDWEEIQAHTLRVTEQHRLRERIAFGCEVVAARFEDISGRWRISARDGREWLCRYWVLASGPLHVPAWPDIPGLQRFRGKLFHSARWDHGYDLAGKRVASIGSGGSAIQYVPEIAPQVAHLHVFQRTAAWVLPRDMRPYSAWRQRLFAHWDWTRVLHRWRLYWSNEWRVWPMFFPPLARAIQRLAAWNMRRQVADKTLAAKLIPNYTLGCKRILISNRWLPTFNRSNVELVTSPIQEIREHSIVTTDGVERAIDCLILGTGFVVDPRRYMQDFVLTGRQGRPIADAWAAQPTAYLGVTTAGFPNWFQLLGPHSALGHNSVLFMIEAQIQYILRCMEAVEARGATWLDLKPRVQQDFSNWVARQLKGSVWASGCTSWYQTADGINFTLWPGSTWKFWLRCRKVVADEYEFGDISAKA